MDDSGPDENEPSELAMALGHAAVGAVAGVVLSRVLKRNMTGFVAGAVLAIVVHSALDAPVARRLTRLGL